MNQPLLQQQINAYIKAYNNFDVAGMLATLHPAITFKNVANGETTLSTKGIEAFEAQTRQAIQFFKQRKQSITDIKFDHQQAEVSIDYEAILAVDLPNGLKAGDTLTLTGKTIFCFENGQIISIKDIS